MKPELVRLARLLAKLYPTALVTRQIMVEIGLQIGYIDAEQAARPRWMAIVQEAENDGRILALFAVALSDYPDHEELRALRAELNSSVTQRLRVLAIWPSAFGLGVLDTQGEADALYNAGIDYVALRGPSATREGVVLEWARSKPEIVEVGAHGSHGSIYLSDGPVRPGWWGRLAGIYAPQLVVLLACETSKPDVFNVADALIRAGVGAVISADESLPDVDAVRFARLFYSELAAGKTVAAAVERAKLTLSDEGAQMVRLQESAVEAAER